MRLIGINGFKRSGKDTTFRFIQMAVGKDGDLAVRRGFADKLKVMGALALGLEGTDQELIGYMDEFKETGTIWWEYDDAAYKLVSSDLSGRQYLQNFGSHARRVFGDTFWIDQVLPTLDGESDPEVAEKRYWAAERVAERFDDADYGVITDVRFPNEAQRVLDLGGEIWEIIRPGLESDGHVSETTLPRELITHTINNDGNLNDLKERVAGLC